MTKVGYITQELGQGWMSSPGLTSKDKQELLKYAEEEMVALNIPVDKPV